MGWSAGVKTESAAYAGERLVTDIDNGDWIGISGVDFGSTGAGAFSASVISLEGGGTIGLHLDDPAGVWVGELSVPAANGPEKRLELMTEVSGAEGVHNLYLVFTGTTGTGLFKLESWQFLE
ncbi:Arabinoxylan arabinofuranohydrolase precursor [compost metagenome]